MQGLNDGIVKSGAHLFDGLAGTVRPRAICQQCDRELAVGINPQAGARVAQMSVGVGAKIFSRLRRGYGSVPAWSARRACGLRLAAGEESCGGVTKDGGSSFEHGVRELREVFGCREQACMAGHSAQHPGVLVLHFALDYAVAECAAWFLICADC